MYGWIWRHLPFGLPGKITGSLLLAAGALAMLWFVVFPAIDPWIEQTLLPWNEGQLEGEFSPAGESGGEPGDQDQPAFEPGIDDELVGPDGRELEDEHDLPYDTDG